MRVKIPALAASAIILIYQGLASGQAQPRNAVLIGWDGAQRNHVQEAMARGELPNLSQLAHQGTIVAIDILRTTDTKAGWSQILSGYEPEITGVFSNSRYRSIPAGYTVFERLENRFGPSNFATVAVIGKKGHVDADPGKPYFITKNACDVFLNGLEFNDVVGSTALNYLDAYRSMPFFFFIHFAEVDTKGHAYGENSKEYNDALISCDVWLGRILEKLEKLDLSRRTLVYVTADHGFDEGEKSHADAPYVFLATNDRTVIRRGGREDIAPTILFRLGLDLPKIFPPLTGRPLCLPLLKPNW